MKDIKNIIAENLIKLRKENNLTQNELANMLSYSDNTVSRWEHAEIAPSIETLQKISEIYKVPIEALLKEDIITATKKETKTETIRRFSLILLCVLLVWFISTIIFFYASTFFHTYPWQIFILDIPISCIVMLVMNRPLQHHIYTFVISTVFVWSTLAYIYLHFIKYNMFLVFIIGIPAELALVIWAFIRPKRNS